MFASLGEMVSWTKVLNGKDEQASNKEATTEPSSKGGIPDWTKRFNGGEIEARTDGMDAESSRASVGAS
jgi:hypothetical protein